MSKQREKARKEFVENEILLGMGCNGRIWWGYFGGEILKSALLAVLGNLKCVQIASGGILKCPLLFFFFFGREGILKCSIAFSRNFNLLLWFLGEGF